MRSPPMSPKIILSMRGVMSARPILHTNGRSLSALARDEQPAL